MGLGPPILALYRQLKALGTFEGIDSVVELGSQGVGVLTGAYLPIFSKHLDARCRRTRSLTYISTTRGPDWLRRVICMNASGSNMTV
jgi:hypothetical protein